MNRFPLTWPAGWPRAKFRKDAKFGNRGRGLSIIDGVLRVMKELARLGVDEADVLISTNVRPRLDGLPRSDQPKPGDPGVAVYWEKKGAMKVMAIDIYTEVADNLAAVAASLEAMRAIERHGGAQILERAFAGFDALPAPGQTSRTWRDVLEITESADLKEARAAYLRLAGFRHPDKGGTHDAMAELNRAWEDAQEILQ